jgi:hypothetical protein
MGIACAGHLRFFSRRTIEDLLAISGWTCVSITGHDPFEHGFADFAAALEVNGIPLSHPDLLPVGHYVLAEHDPAVSPL